MYIPLNPKKFSKKIALIIVDNKSKPEKEEKKKNSLVDWLEKHSSLALALSTVGLFFATMALVWITYKNIEVSNRMATATQDMAMQTENMAKLTKTNNETLTEQFKIKSYPTFVFEILENSFDSENFKYKVKIENRGEITAFDANILVASSYKRRDGSLHFITDIGANYESDDENTTSMDFNKNILGKSFLTVTGKSIYYEGYTIDDYKYFLVFIRFKVPYAHGYSYQEEIFQLREHPESTKEKPIKYLQVLNDATSEFVIKKFLEGLHGASGYLNDKVKVFFSDYEKD